jgi:precorrin-2 dehydrogenase/sirohydrochlorin ferrochelatase
MSCSPTFIPVFINGRKLYTVIVLLRQWLLRRLQKMKRTGRGYYPLMLDLAGKRCVVIGGGRVAERKTESLVEAGATVTVISPDCTSWLERRAEIGEVMLIRDRYRPGMSQLQEALLVFAATDQADVNAAVRLEAEALGKLVTVADDLAGSGFIVPAVVRRGRLVLAVSTEGASPAVAGLVRDELDRMFGAEYETYLELLQELRSLVQASVSETTARQRIYKQMLEWELLSWIRTGRFDASAKQELLIRVEAGSTLDGMKVIEAWVREQAQIK